MTKRGESLGEGEVALRCAGNASDCRISKPLECDLEIKCSSLAGVKRIHIKWKRWIQNTIILFILVLHGAWTVSFNSFYVIWVKWLVQVEHFNIFNVYSSLTKQQHRQGTWSNELYESFCTNTLNVWTGVYVGFEAEIAGNWDRTN